MGNEYNEKVKKIMDILDKDKNGQSDLLVDIIVEIQNEFYKLGKEVQSLGLNFED